MSGNVGIFARYFKNLAHLINRRMFSASPPEKCRLAFFYTLNNMNEKDYCYKSNYKLKKKKKLFKEMPQNES